MPGNIFEDAKLTIIDGIGGGLFFAIGFKYKVPTDEGEVGIYVLNQLLAFAKTTLPDFNFLWVELIIIFVSFALFLISLLVLLVSINRVGNWKAGLILYAIGFVIGVLMIYH
jgi:hypothetical protein